MNALELTGRVATHVRALTDPSCLLHHQAVVPFQQLRRAARQQGFDLQAVSAFRDFDRQLAIWNAKFEGSRPLYDRSGGLLDAATLTVEQRVEAILIWSALPGASRHHWGSDVDLVDHAAVPAGYRPQLSAAEFAAGGPFAALSQWLAEQAGRFGFFRPFRGVVSAVQAEAWHWSFAPVAERARRDLGVEVLREALAAAPLAGKPVVLEQLESLHARYVRRVDWP